MGTLAVKIVGSASVLLLLGCAAQSQPKGLPSTPAKAVERPTAKPEKPAPSSVAAPDGLFAVVRLAHPGTLAQGIGNWVGFPINLGMLDGLEPGLSTLIVPDAAIEAAVAVSHTSSSTMDEGLGVVSVGITDAAQARKLFESKTEQTMVEKGEGVWQSPQGVKPQCAIAPALGVATLRMVCGSSEEALAALVPYATRGLPREELGQADLHAELRTEMLVSRYSGLMRTGKAMAVPELIKELGLRGTLLERPLAELANATGDEFIEIAKDMERLVLDATLNTKTEEMELTLQVRLRSTQSWFGGVVTDLAGKSAPPPPVFFTLPADASSASYGYSPSAAHWQRASTILSSVLDAALTAGGVDAPLRQETTKALSELFSMSGNQVSASGPVVLDRAARERKGASPMAEQMGWMLYGFESSSAPLHDALTALSRVTNHAAWRKYMVDKVLLNGSPTKAGNAARKTADARIPRVRTITIAGLPKGAEAFTLELESGLVDGILTNRHTPHIRNAKDAQLALAEITVILLPDGNRTWLAMAGDRTAAATQIQRIAKPGAMATLATRGDLSTLRDQPAVSAGYTSLMMFRGTLIGLAVKEGKTAALVDSLISTIPNHAATPIFERLSISGNKTTPVAEVKITVPRRVVDDIAASIPTLMTLD
jgi:hypothetical protein